MKDLIKCPHCGKDIEVTEVLTHQIRASVEAQIGGEFAKKEQAFAKEQAALKQREKELLAAKEALDEQVNEKLKTERLKLAEQKKALEAQQSQIDEQVAARVKAEKQKISEVERQRILAEQAEQTKAMVQELEEKKRQLSEAVRKELDLRRERQKLEEEKQAMELTVQRKLDEERKKIAEEAAAKATGEQQLKLKEKDQLIEALRKQAQDWQRRAEQGSQEAQGEALEGRLKDQLSQTFAIDIIEDVKKGAHGADLVQRVRNNNLKECGVILWEAKNAQQFSKEWIAKLKKDQQEAGADVAVLVAVTLPKNVEIFDYIDEVWVTDYRNAVCLSMALRHGLISAARERLVAANQESTKDVLYRYITGQEFGLQIRTMVGAFKRMQEDLEMEKRAMQKCWKSREKQIETVLGGMSGIWGAIEGYVGQKELPEGDPLMLDEGEANFS